MNWPGKMICRVETQEKGPPNWQFLKQHKRLVSWLESHLLWQQRSMNAIAGKIALRLTTGCTKEDVYSDVW